MQFALKARRLALAVCVMSCALPATASAESAYVQQITRATQTSAAALQSINSNITAVQPPVIGSRLQRVNPETAFVSGNNIAQNLQIGSYNQILQVQSGANNLSTVGVIAGYANNVGVLQAGNNLRSNLVLLNTSSLNVGVIQPNGSAPVNMLIARLPNGSLLIKR